MADRLISADALDNALTELRFNADGELAHWGDRKDWCLHGNEIEKLIADAPTVDAVEVVRCKDCVYCKRFNDVWYLPKRDELLCTLYVETYHTTENDYCSRGERR